MTQLQADGSKARVFACGVAVAGTHATRPLVQIRMIDSGVTIEPRWRWLGLLFPPVYRFGWEDVGHVDLLITLGTPRGLRFVLSRPAAVRGPLGAFFAVWPGPIRRIRIGLGAADLEAVLTLVPSQIPVKRLRWLGP